MSVSVLSLLPGDDPKYTKKELSLCCAKQSQNVQQFNMLANTKLEIFLQFKLTQLFYFFLIEQSKYIYIYCIYICIYLAVVL